MKVKTLLSTPRMEALGIFDVNVLNVFPCITMMNIDETYHDSIVESEYEEYNDCVASLFIGWLFFGMEIHIFDR